MKNILNMLNKIFAQLLKTVLRFPVATLCSVAMFAVCTAHTGNSSIPTQVINFCLAVIPAFVLAVAARVFAEDAGWTGWRRWIDVLAIAVAALMFAFCDPEEPFGAYRYGAYAIASLAALSCAPLRGGRSATAFWRYNISLLWQAAFALLCTGIFYGGLAFALASVDKLFAAQISSEHYERLAYFLLLLVAPMLFATGIPTPRQLADNALDAKIFRVIGLYVLLPLALVYLAILYVYALTILVAWELPRGWISIIILAYSCVGIVTYAALHELYLSGKKTAATLFGKYFFYTELPLVPLLVLAIYRRTADYGVTEERYYVWLLALWLLGASLYMIFLRGKSLRPLIVSLAVVGVLSVCGWWSASEVSNRSQLAQFLRLVDDNNLLSDGKITQEIQLKNNEAGNETGKQLSSIMRYFGDKKRLDVLQPYFSANIDSIWLSKGSYSWEKAMVQYNDFEEEMMEQHQPGKVRLVASMELDALDVSGYARLYSCESGHTPMDSVENGITYDHRTQKILVYRNNKLEKSIDMLAAIASLNLVDTAIDVRYFLPQSKLSVVVDDSTKVVFKRIDCTFFNLDKHGAFDEPDDVQIKDIDAFILMK